MAWPCLRIRRAPQTLGRSRGRLGRFKGDDRGATAVEFGLVAVPFLALIFAIIETSVALWRASVLDVALFDAARVMYTGSFQTSNPTSATNDAAAAQQQQQNMLAKLRAELCRSVNVLFDCSQVKLDVRPFTPGSPPPSPLTADGQVASNFGQYYSPGPNEMVIVRAAVETPVFVSLLNPKMSNLANGKRLVVATAVFRTEPFR